MPLLENHLDQIQLCSSTIEQLPFPAPKIFTNAMLRTTDITSLIRDTEAHERALFSLTPDEQEDTYQRRRTVAANKRRTTVFPAQQEAPNYSQKFHAPRKGTAVAAVLGGDLNARIRREYQRETHDPQRDRRQQRDDFDVELLLTGAQRLCSVYPIAGAMPRISALRARNVQVTDSLEHYEQLVEEQAAQMGRMNGISTAGLDDEADEELVASGDRQHAIRGEAMTEEDLRREEEAIAALERRKRVLEERVSGIEKDLGGLMR